MKNVDVKEYSSFLDFVNKTTRRQRNAILGSAVVFDANGYDSELVANKIAHLIDYHQNCLEGLNLFKPLADKDVLESKRRKAALARLQTMPIEELENIVAM